MRGAGEAVGDAVMHGDDLVRAAGRFADGEIRHRVVAVQGQGLSDDRQAGNGVDLVDGVRRGGNAQQGCHGERGEGGFDKAHLSSPNRV